MSDVDSFVQEVTEDLRRDRMLKVWKDWGAAVIGAVVMVVAATAIIEWRKQQDEAAAQDAGAVLIEAVQSVTADAKVLRFEEASEALEGGPALLAQLGAASARAEAGETGLAAEAFNGVADLGSADPLYRDLAAFKAALSAQKGQSAEERADAMTRFAGEGAPFRLLALEQRAAALMEAGRPDAARADIAAIEADPMASRNLRARLAQLSEILGEE